MVEISRSTRMSLINGVPLNQDTLSVNDKFFPTIKGKRKPAQAHLSFRGRNDRGFRQVEVVLRRRENRDPVARVEKERGKRREIMPTSCEAIDEFRSIRNDRGRRLVETWSCPQKRAHPRLFVPASASMDGHGGREILNNMARRGFF